MKQKVRKGRGDRKSKSNDATLKGVRAARRGRKTPIDTPLELGVFDHHELLRTEEAAQFLRLAPQTLVVGRCTGKIGIPFVKVGGRVFYMRSDLEKFLENHKRVTTK